MASLIPKPPRPTSERQSGTVGSNSCSKHQMSFPLKRTIIHFIVNLCPF